VSTHPITMAVDTPLAGYRLRAGSFDEMIGRDGRVREHWAHLAQSLDELGLAELTRRRGEADRLLEEDGVTYHAYGAARRGARWGLDPVPVLLSSQEWTDIETGVVERAELLNLILDDLYGERDLVRRGLVPPEVVFAHDGFLRPCDRIRLPGTQQLLCYAADLVRHADGQWQVMADRTQTPTGFGYALENRTVTSRVFPSLYRDAHVHRLAPFFRSLRVALQDAAPGAVDDPRIVVLSPGPFNETAFEHAFLAANLGYPLVEGSDLTVRNGRVWMRALGRLEPVHVILRRVDDWYCDPLELKPDSRLGVAGLLEASRRGTVSIVNTLGSGVLENPALMSRLPRLSEHLLGRALRLASLPTWWCGEDADLRYVLGNITALVLKPIARQPGVTAVFGWELSSDEIAELRARIEARPYLWVGQERATPASTPSLVDGALVPRRAVLRAFAVSRRDSYVTMAGGLTRVADADDAERISNQAGAISKDTWVLASEPERLTGFWLHTGPPVEAVDPTASIASRAAENLFWLGRYTERAEDTARLLRAAYDRRNDFQGSASDAGVQALRALLGALTRVSGTHPGFLGEDGEARLASPGAELFSLVVDESRAGTLAHAVRRLLDAAFAVRDQLSTDTWLVISSLDREIVALRGPLADPQAAVQMALQQVMASLLAFAGLEAESMVRDLGWRFLDAGRRLERALQLVTLLRATVTQVRGTATDSLVIESILTAAESIITYRRRYRSQAQLATVLDLLLLDPGNPRSVVFQLDRLVDDLGAIPAGTPQRLRDEQKLVLDAATGVRIADTTALATADPDGRRVELDRFLFGIESALLQASDAVDRSHFVHPPPQRSLAGLTDPTTGDLP
jgi:uncharacterized circularly permuted ATP-grasp superfamily protein/uncharacterized alpha-E superfamily protein